MIDTCYINVSSTHVNKWLKPCSYFLRMRYKFLQHKFAMNNPKVLPTGQLLQNIWSENGAVTSKFVSHLHSQEVWTGLKILNNLWTLKCQTLSDMNVMVNGWGYMDLENVFELNAQLNTTGYNGNVRHAIPLLGQGIKNCHRGYDNENLTS